MKAKKDDENQGNGRCKDWNHVKAFYVEVLW
jgi:hypothetical protein